MKKEIAIVNDLMSKYGLTKKDLFSFCICAVNFLEYYMEEGMGDMMYDCPERYYGTDSNNTRAVAGALTGEKKSQGWTDEEQFAYYMRSVQGILADDIENDDLEHFQEELWRFKKVYKRQILVPIMLGSPVEDFDDSRFDDEDYINSIVNKDNLDNLTLNKAHDEDLADELRAYREKEEAKTAKEVEERKNDKDFSVLLASSISVKHLADSFREYNQKYYPDRTYNVIPLNNKPNCMIIQTGGKDIEEVKEMVLRTVKRSVIICGRETHEELRPVEKVFNVIPKELKDNKVTHVVAYF